MKRRAANKLPKPFYRTKDGMQAIYCGDSLELLPLFEPESVDLVLTDPPYGINYQEVQGSRPNEKKMDEMINDEYEMDLGFLLERPELKIIFGAQHFLKQLPFLGRWLCWDKRVNSKADKMIGSAFELAWISQNFGYYKIYRVMHGGVVNADGVAQPRAHPTQKPTKLMVLILTDFSQADDTILDPFLGSGTTLVACKKLNRKGIGIEIEEKYCEIAAKRLDAIHYADIHPEHKKEGLFY